MNQALETHDVTKNVAQSYHVMCLSVNAHSVVFQQDDSHIIVVQEKLHMSSFTKSDSLVSVTLHTNRLNENDGYYGKITRNTVTLENIIAEIQERNSGIDPYMVQHVAHLLEDTILSLLAQGKAVNVLNLGTLYVAVSGGINGANPSATAVNGFAAKFTPSTSTNQAVASIVVDKVVVSQTAPLINTVECLWNAMDPNTIRPGKMVRLTGSRLRLGETNSGIAFVPVDTEGNPSDNPDDAIAVDATMVMVNNPKTLEFYAPDSLDGSTKYAIKVSTNYIKKGSQRKEALSCWSHPQSIVKD